MGKAKRKQRPEPSNWFYMYYDNCWWCNNRNGCSNCKTAKMAVARERDKAKHKERAKNKHTDDTD